MQPNVSGKRVFPRAFRDQPMVPNSSQASARSDATHQPLPPKSSPLQELSDLVNSNHSF